MASSANARATMRANRRVSLREVAFRHALWHAGARGYRLHVGLPGRPDVAFPALRLAIFVNGCFWHGCPKCKLPMPTANAEFWAGKLHDNRDRDRRARAQLRLLGWTPVTIWEHDIRPDPTPKAFKLAEFIDALRAALRHAGT